MVLTPPAELLRPSRPARRLAIHRLGYVNLTINTTKPTIAATMFGENY
jgi:hypothetical protein